MGQRLKFGSRSLIYCRFVVRTEARGFFCPLRQICWDIGSIYNVPRETVMQKPFSPSTVANKKKVNI